MLAETNPGRRFIAFSVASLRICTSSSCLPGSTVNTLMRVTGDVPD